MIGAISLSAGSSLAYHASCDNGSIWINAEQLLSEARGLLLSVSIPNHLPQDMAMRWKWSRFMQEKELYNYPSYLSMGASHIANSSSWSSSVVMKQETSSEVGGAIHSCSNCLNRDTFANAAASVGPAVVTLSLLKGFHGLGVQINGSGTIIDKDGTILTCAHLFDFESFSGSGIIKEEIDVTLEDGRMFKGRVEIVDLELDIAIVKITSKTPFPCAKLGTSSKLRPGDFVISIGCPMSLRNSVTAGIVSCVQRDSNDLGVGGMKKEYIQADCAVNRGNSGGPLINLDGEVIGVNVMKSRGGDGLGFYVPIDSVSKIIIEHLTNNRTT